MAFPVVVSAFAPLWVAVVTAGAMLAFTLYFSKSGIKKGGKVAAK